MGGDFEVLALAHMAVGFELSVYGCLRSGGGSDVEGLIISGFICYLVAFLLGAIAHFGELKGNKIVQIVILVLLLVAAILIIVGVAVWGNGIGANQTPYIVTLDITSAALAIIAAVFLILVVAGGGGSGRGGNKTGP